MLDLNNKQNKNDLASATLLSFAAHEAKISLTVDASDTCIGGVVQQKKDQSDWMPLAFFSKTLSTAQQKYSAYDRELLAIYEGIRHFIHFFEGRQFTVFTDHKPLIFAFNKNPAKGSPRQIRQLDYIGQFTTDIRHVSGENNVVADTLSRISEISLESIDYSSLAAAQASDPELLAYLANTTSPKVQQISIPGGITLYCNTSASLFRPYVPLAFRRQVFDSLHGISHPASPAELVYGQNLRLPADLILPKLSFGKSDYVNQLKEHFSDISPKVTTHHANPSVFIPLELAKCSHVFVRKDLVKPPLSPPYEGPFLVLERRDKFFFVLIKNRSQSVSIDRLKPACIEKTDKENHQSNSAVKETSRTAKHDSFDTNRRVVTRSGRAICEPVRFTSA